MLNSPSFGGGLLFPVFLWGFSQTQAGRQMPCVQKPSDFPKRFNVETTTSLVGAGVNPMKQVYESMWYLKIGSFHLVSHSTSPESAAIKETSHQRDHSKVMVPVSSFSPLATIRSVIKQMGMGQI